MKMTLMKDFGHKPTSDEVNDVCDTLQCDISQTNVIISKLLKLQCQLSNNVILIYKIQTINVGLTLFNVIKYINNILQMHCIFT